MVRPYDPSKDRAPVCNLWAGGRISACVRGARRAASNQYGKRDVGAAMAERADTHDEVDRLLRQGVRDLTEPVPSSDGIWQKIRRRIERERGAQPPDPTAANECHRAVAAARIIAP